MHSHEKYSELPTESVKKGPREVLTKSSALAQIEWLQQNPNIPEKIYSRLEGMKQKLQNIEGLLPRSFSESLAKLETSLQKREHVSRRLIAKTFTGEPISQDQIETIFSA